MSMFVAALIVLTSFLVTRWFKNSRRRMGRPLPPGPPAHPVLGHLLSIPHEKQAEAFAEWGKKYGDVLYLNALGKDMVVLNSEQAANDLLDKRSANYSDRSYLPIYDLLGIGEGLPMLPYGDKFTLHRKLLAQPFSKRGCDKFLGIQTRQRKLCLQHLLKTPEDFEQHTKRYMAAGIIEVTFGHEVLSDDDYFLKMANNVNDILGGAGVPGTSILDVFPILRFLPSWVPGAWFVRHGKKFKPMIREMWRIGMTEVQGKIESGTAGYSFTAHRLQELSQKGRDTPENLWEVEVAAGILYGAGFETSWSTVHNWLLIIMRYPEALKKAQEEIDRVIGSDRLPTLEDRASLPYVDAIIGETIRYHPTAPLGIPHRSMADDEYRGMFIPKGSMVIANLKSMGMDENVYSDPHIFNPDRFLPKPAGNGEPYPNIVFGFGRRICPGRYFADRGIWILISGILATFDILPPKDKFGDEYLPELKFTNSITCHAGEFECRFVPRSSKAKELIESL